MLLYWEHYVEKIDILIQKSLILNVQCSMDNVYAQHNDPIFLISVNLDGNKVRCIVISLIKKKLFWGWRMNIFVIYYKISNLLFVNKTENCFILTVPQRSELTTSKTVIDIHFSYTQNFYQSTLLILSNTFL